MSPNDTFRPALSLPVEQAMSFLSLASRHIPRAEQLDTARDLGLSTTPAVDENGFSETALALCKCHHDDGVYDTHPADPP